MPKTAVDLPLREFRVDVVQGSFTPLFSRSLRWRIDFFFSPLSFSSSFTIESVNIRVYIYIRAWKNTTFRIHNGKSDTRDARKSLTERFHEGTGYRCAYQQARFLCPVATRQAPKILHISKLTKREKERERRIRTLAASQEFLLRRKIKIVRKEY